VKLLGFSEKIGQFEESMDTGDLETSNSGHGTAANQSEYPPVRRRIGREVISAEFLACI
jgi:hypothetical protein